ncbi:MAG: Undecaprenyl-phosphate galactose phosphotransferase [Candidatus Daviesbacteria bacterium GW2011_GWA1_41_61]|uniref:Undecaprenyl-phosphate galactose phosphotransferase n=1 Tax=Candidatus Daviesbacteria bacterium GW2011_GWA2_40_9 TaxID=1618424 RepID=A0A0G0X5R9_9BACT|nr:MAG: Undecaprenyl-phosphate galactose phosphotransferase [Candidatus Daviesbacteria bacterium GW2011_GWC1_40_9]KKR82992.1 MAG: Undecaprenyl-phosphate galactose phosphotransferase [Candidatus Daviesbacteria bacterium GW2011_GWA2_40_9]KKR92918.1 MAG: Undecaprenyl-phosphate galactose phosphotransferase [Candidatus Daviesbacteria bacterium GW2011_GWB1_41_15]KKS15462.1 MAG: Undecaprenyl-phosphate galactose phosphotransferase [Candidatus Daviesbacteria bacterium GW2011_GWA1_41_61]
MTVVNEQVLSSENDPAFPPRSQDQTLVLDSKVLAGVTPSVGLFSYETFKRLIDIVGSLVGIIILSPLMLIMAFLIKLDSKGPILADIPKRVGKDGKLFKMYKFRSMIVGAHELLHKDPQFKELLEKYQHNSYKLDRDEDPRITRAGKFIRKTSIDELPQFFNVLKGEMSLVGPRAYNPFELEEQQEKYPSTKRFVKIILSAKPGLTGLWQVSGRSEINFDKRVELDAKYVQRRSILYDLWLILNTIPAVLLGKGAV